MRKAHTPRFADEGFSPGPLAHQSRLKVPGHAMFELFISILPLAIASAASPVILGVSIALLSRKDFKSAAAFLAGGIVVAAILAAAGASIAAGDDKVEQSLGYPGIVNMAIGLLFLIFGVKVLLEKPSEKERVPGEGKKMGPAKWFAISFIGNITNFDAVLLNLAAVREIFNSGIAMLPKLLLTAFCDFFFILPALLPIAIFVLAPAASQRVLVPIGGAMSRYGKYIVAAIFIVFGAYLILKVV